MALRRRHADARVERDHAVGAGQQRVDVELGD